MFEEKDRPGQGDRDERIDTGIEAEPVRTEERDTDRPGAGPAGREKAEPGFAGPEASRAAGSDGGSADKEETEPGPVGPEVTRAAVSDGGPADKEEAEPGPVGPEVTQAAVSDAGLAGQEEAEPGPVGPEVTQAAVSDGGPADKEEAEPGPAGPEISQAAAPDAEDNNREEAEREKRISPLRRWGIRFLTAVLILAVTFLMTFCYSLWSEYSAKESREGKEITVEIPKGTGLNKMAVILQDAGVIRYRTSFVARVVFTGYLGKLKYGKYKLNDGDCLADLIDTLSKGAASKDDLRFVVPEGYSAEMIADKLEKQGIMSSEEFLEALRKAEDGFVYEDQLPSEKEVFYPLQGYLFPDTYHLSENISGDRLVKMMLDTFVSKFDEKRQAEAKKLGLSVEDVLIRASLVQKETEQPGDYATIAGVINNRLEKGMKIQFDTTVVYAMSNGMYGVEKVTYDDLSLESPYNTYHIKGLPPGPICNPGLEAIDGVLHAEKHDYLFFRTDPDKDDGSNIFTTTYEEHNSLSGETGQEADDASSAAQDTDAGEKDAGTALTAEPKNDED